MSSLPPAPSLEHLRKLARTLVTSARAGDPEALDRLRSHTSRPKEASGTMTRPTLSQAQLTIAREHGFPSWPRLKKFVTGQTPGLDLRIEKFKIAIWSGDVAGARRILEHNPEIVSGINDPWFDFDSPAVCAAAGQGNRELIDMLLEFGADINARSRWWAGGFGVLPHPDPEFAAFLEERGAVVDAHAAAGMDRLERLKELIEADPQLVNARGGDGQTPLHYASTVRIAEFLLDHGAEIETRDLDHGGTAAQYMAVDRPEVCRYLLSRGAAPDIFMAVQLGDASLVRRLVDDDPACVHHCVGRVPFTSGDSEGGHIYVYTLQTGHSPLRLAADLGRDEIFRIIAQRSSPTDRFLVACWMGNDKEARRITAENAGLMESLGPEEMRLIADAAWANRTVAVDLMLRLGFDADVCREGESTALNRAAVRGYADLIDLLLAHGASLEAVNEFGGRPLSAALWGAENFRDPNGDYPAAVSKLLTAGAPLADVRYPSKNRAVKGVLRRYLENLSEDNLIAAIKLGRLERAARLLDRDPSRSNRLESGILPLCEAVRSRDPEMVDLLVRHGANPSLQPEGGKSPLEEAETIGNEEILKILRAARPAS